MKSVCTIALTVSLLLIGGGVALAQFENVGSIEFPTSGSPEAQQHFLRGVSILHSFGWKQAIEQFQAAQEIEPDFAMAYWGESLAYNHPLFAQQDVESPREVLSRLAPTQAGRLAKAPTDREKDFLTAVEILFGEGSYRERAVGYMEQMHSMYERYPDDSEVAAYYALSLLSASNATRDMSQRLNVRAGTIALKMFEQKPNHPGVAHYTIHAFDNPVHAPLALAAAYRFAEIAPAVSHARHMPTHIFIQHGMWDRVSANNQSAYDAARDLWEPGDSIGDAVHSLDWGQYGDLQRGDYAKAKAWIGKLEAITEDAESGEQARGSNSIPLVKARYIVETEEWMTQPVTDESSAHELLATAMSAAHTGDRATLREAETALNELAERDEGGGRFGGSYTKIMAKQVSALLQADLEQADMATTLLDEAEEMLRPMRPPAGAASPIKPVYELHGEILLDLDRPADAIEKFETSLLRMPNRPRSLLGLARAYAKTGDSANAAEHYTNLAKVWEGRDAFEGLQEAKRFLETTEEQP